MLDAKQTRPSPVLERVWLRESIENEVTLISGNGSKVTSIDTNSRMRN